MNDNQWHWSDTARNAMLFDMIEAKSLMFLLVWWMHARTWTAVLVIIVLLASIIANFYGMNTKALMRSFRLSILRIAGPYRPIKNLTVYRRRTRG